MKFSIASEITYEVYAPTTFILNIHAAQTKSQIIIEESIFTKPFLPFEEFSLPHGEARFIRMEAPAGNSFTIYYQATVDVYHNIISAAGLNIKIPISALDPATIPFLFPSRHCQSDKLSKFALQEFGKLTGSFAKATAISDWIYSHIEYLSGTTNSGTSAYDTITQREGVCKDFAHLGIALCRALDIPARYFTGYACLLFPPDFHACFEAYIGGRWIFFDPTKLVPINGLVKIANSKDAAEAAVANYFGNTVCTYMKIQCYPAQAGFVPFFNEPGITQGLCYQL